MRTGWPAVVLLFCASKAAQAEVTLYTDQGLFLSSVADSGTDTFNDLAAGTGLSTPLARSAGAYTYTATAGPTSDFFTASDGGADTWLSTNVGTDTITFGSFSAGVQGIGAYLFATDIAGNYTATPLLTITATDASGIYTFSLLDPTTTSFMGFLSTGQLTSLSVSIGDVPGAWATVNDLTVASIASPAPEPSSVAMMLAGLVGVGWFAGRRRSAAHG